MRYVIESVEEVFTDIDDVLNYCIDPDYHQDDDEFCDWINELYSGAYIAGTFYSAFDILDGCDVYKLDQLRTEYCRDANDRDRDEARQELLDAEPGDTIEIQGYDVIVEDEDEQDEEVKKNFEEAMQELRMRLEQDKIEKNKQEEEDRKIENDLLSTLQIVGG